MHNHHFGQPMAISIWLYRRKKKLKFNKIFFSFNFIFQKKFHSLFRLFLTFSGSCFFLTKNFCYLQNCNVFSNPTEILAKIIPHIAKTSFEQKIWTTTDCQFQCNSYLFSYFVFDVCESIFFFVRYMNGRFVSKSITEKNVW